MERGIGIIPGMNTLQDWLAHCERLHPQGISGIEMGLDRVQRVVSGEDQD